MRSCERVLRLLGAPLLLLAGGVSALPPALPLDRLPDVDRARLTERAARLATMSAAEREALLARQAAWAALPAAERARRRLAFEAAADLPDAERARLQRAAAYFDSLPEDAQQALRVRFEQVDLGLRRGWLLGPTLGAMWPRLHPLFAAMPEAQRAPAIAALRAASPQALDDLALLAQRTPPQDRDALRRQWLAVPAPERDAWLRARASP
ncbi:DUF3106 domain-containing protein [Luteimonas sp. S4-F44]|uniref:DUF3106 domain-containing protein n=1 Tax=Luteimonas sp. S4-F44 TaxID=2925842 RepID=UPI001F53608C|nr:DUF3106 domain-containing protein [Luteimonas sp. S4-F44]UNK41880.1 DUF3106 domain-containing protein [Luteimonas sp. S4-F44]